jgi:aminopeptidase
LKINKNFGISFGVVESEDCEKKLAEGNKAIYPIVKPINDAMSDKYQWTIAAIPSAKWAKLVFPNLSKSKAVEALWEQILACARITDDPIDAWNKHNAYIEEKANTLTYLDIDYLHYTNSLGTNFKVWLLENTHFIAGGEYAKDSNIFYNPNMPTEECFTSPKKGAAEGIVYASKPLSYMGELIEEFSVKFENGKAVEVKAKKGVELLQQLISMDEGASYLGEVALVPYDSPVSKSNILFYNTLFDENAACHLALGMGFTNVYNDYEKYTKQEINDKGINDSMVHVDFMIGTPDLSIVGYTRKGEKIQVFKDGNWSI